ncbi:MAG: hypothetical protein J2P18_16630, partial [Nocardia sp.]|nr:hypothetical protein [Nocardia sp.]
MSETNTTPTGRVRRRSSRQAGPPVDGAPVTEATVSTAPASTTGKATTEKVGSESGSATKSTAAASQSGAAAQESASEARESAAAVPASGSSDEPVKNAVPEADSSSTSDGQTAKLDRRGWFAVAAAVISLAVLIGSAGAYAYHHHQRDALLDQRAAYVQTAKQAVLNLTNIKDDTAKQDIDRVLAVASGQLKAEYSERKDAYAQVVEQAKVKASGEIIETAVERQDGKSARILVAAKQTLTNAGAKDPQER